MKNMALRFTTVLILAASFSVITGVLLIGQNMQRVLTLWGESLQMTVYLSENTSAEITDQLATTLKENEMLDKVQYVSSEKALEVFRDQMASYAPDLLGDQELVNAIPPSFQFSLSPSIQPENQLEAMKQIASSLKVHPGVDEVAFGQDWVRNYSQIVSAFNWAGMIMAAVIIFGAVFVISNCLRSAIHQRRDEIEVLELIGATARYIRRPFLIEGLVLCGAGCVLGILNGFGVYMVVLNSMKSQLEFLQLSQHFQFLKADTIFLMFFGALAVGWIATVVCLSTLNDGWAASQKQRTRET